MESGDWTTTWTVTHAVTQSAGRLAFSLTALSGETVQWDSRGAILQINESVFEGESKESEEPYIGRLATLEGDMAQIRGEWEGVQDEFDDLKEVATAGVPVAVEEAAGMINDGHIYIYTGDEDHFATGHVYYYVDGTLTDGGVYGGTAVDATLTESGQAADAKVVGDEIAEIKEDLSTKTGLSEEAKQALLACFAKVAWVDEHGQDYYDALDDALYPPVDLVRITAVYTQSGTVYDTDTLDSLKSDLVVTAHYSDSTSSIITGYALSGTLTEGTSTITVSYGGKTTTFDVTVTGLQDRDIPGTDMSWVRGYVTETGAITATGSSNGTWTSDYFAIPDGYATFNISLDGATGSRMAFFDANKTIISRVLSNTGNIPSGAAYGRATVIKAALGNTSYDGTGTMITLKA
jgi:hypothetical protein